MSVDLVILSEVRLYREGLALTLADQATNINVVGTSADPEKVAELLDLYPTAVVLVDVTLPDANVAVRRLSSRSPVPRFVALALMSSSGADQDIVAAAEAGFSGFVRANATVEELIATVKQVVRGELICSPQAAASLARRLAMVAESQAQPSGAVTLTPREKEVAELLAIGFSNKQIARRLRIRLPTVKNHVHSVLSKLNVERRAKAAAAMRGELSAGRRLPETGAGSRRSGSHS